MADSWRCFVHFAVLATISGSLGSEIHQLLVPAQVVSGSDVVLRCLFDVEDSLLYSIKWYKGKHEFYRYLPREKPPAKVFPWASFQITNDISETGKVILHGVTREAEGTYKCEVSTEGPFFDTDFRESNLTVLDIRNIQGPVITRPEGKTQVRVGERLRLNCTFSSSRPPAILSWFINGEPISSSSYRRYVREDVDTLKTSLSSLDLLLNSHHFRSKALTVTCLAAVGSIYKRRAELRLVEVSNKPPTDITSTARTDTQLAMAKTAGSHAPTNGVNRVAFLPFTKLVLLFSLVTHCLLRSYANSRPNRKL